MKVKGVVQELQENQERVTLKAIGEKMNMNPANYYHNPKIITFLREVVEKDKKREIQENFSSREEELVCQVSDVIQAMQLLMQPISLNAVAKVMRVSPTRLQHYPKVRLMIESAKRNNFSNNK